jgi:hypothetical protein
VTGGRVSDLSETFRRSFAEFPVREWRGLLNEE